MTAPVTGFLFAPVAIWAGAGIALAVMFGRSRSTAVLRLTAIFLGFWALLATTTLVWVLANGGWDAVVTLARAPLTIFDGRFLDLWLYGAAGAFLIFLTAFVISQLVARGFLAVLRPTPLAWPAPLALPSTPTELYVFVSGAPDAFTFTLLAHGGSRLFRRKDVVMVSTGLLAILSDEEQVAVVAHELGHLRELDGRYLAFFRTLSRLMRWDPVLAILANSLTRREEFRADLNAVELTRRPRALARALFKVSQGARAPRGLFGASSLLGVGGVRGRRDAIERIRRLVTLAESGRFPEDGGA
jgi:Zn-dependent protease with chaperone function